MVTVIPSVWTAICAHLDASGADEAAGIALVRLQQHEDFSPHRPQSLSDITAVNVVGFVPIPLQSSRRTPLSVEVLPDASEPVNAAIVAACRASPDVRAAAYVHSHPFACGTTSPSSGDIVGHMRPLLQRNRSCGLEVSFSFIAARAGQGWVLCCYALDQAGVSDLGVACIADVAACARPPIKRHLRRWRRTLAAQTQAQVLFDGWLRCVVQVGRAHAVLLCGPSGQCFAWITHDEDAFHLSVSRLDMLDALFRQVR